MTISASNLPWNHCRGAGRLLTSFVLGDRIILSVDLCYALYGGIVLGFLAFCLRRTRLDLRVWKDFRSVKINQPYIGSAIGVMPTLLTANPTASPISHVVLHVTAVLHAPNTDLFLPPHREQCSSCVGCSPA